jgi:hypothetical protein
MGFCTPTNVVLWFLVNVDVYASHFYNPDSNGTARLAARIGQTNPIIATVAWDDSSLNVDFSVMLSLFIVSCCCLFDEL